MPTSLARRLTLILGTQGSRGVNRALNGINKRINTVTASARVLRAVTVGAFLAVTVAMAGSVRSAAQFDAAMVKSTAIMGDLSDVMRNDLAKAARDMALETTFSATQAAESFFFLASAGLDAGASLKALPVVAKFAQAGMFDMALATDLLTDAQSALGLTIRDDAVANMRNMIRVSDVLVKANTLANATVQQFSTALTREAGAALKSFDIDVEEGVAVLAAFADQGVKAELAGTSLSRILRLMTTAAVDNKEAYEEFNVSVFDAFGQIRNLADIVFDLENALGDLSDESRVAALSQLGFQARVQGVILPLLGTSEAIRQYEKDLRSAAGTTNTIANKQLQSAAAQFDLLGSIIEDISIGIGEQLLPSLVNAAKALRNFLTSNREAITSAGSAMSMLLNIILNVIGAIADWVSQNRQILGTLANLTIALGLVATAVFAIQSPIILIGLAVIAGIEIWNRWGNNILEVAAQVRDFMHPFVNTLAQLFVFVGRVATIAIRRVLEFFRDSFMKMLEFAKPFFDFLTEAWNYLLEIVGKVANAITNIWNDTMDRIRSIDEDAVGANISFLEEIGITAKEVFTTDYVEAVESGVSSGIRLVGEGVDEMKAKLMELGQTPFSGAGAGRAGAGRQDFTPSALDTGGGAVNLGELPIPDEDSADKVLPPAIVDRFREMISLTETFEERLDVIAQSLGATFGLTAGLVFKGFQTVAKNTFATVEKLSAGYFTGERKNWFNLRELSKVAWAEIKAAAIEAIAGILKSRAEQWALEAAASALSGNFARAAGFSALALAAGGAAAVLSGAAAGIREKAQREFDEATLRTEEESSGTSESSTDSGTLGSTVRRGTVTEIPERNVTYAPVTQFIANDGGAVFVGPDGLEEAADSLNTLILRAVQNAQAGGEI